MDRRAVLNAAEAAGSPLYLLAAGPLAVGVDGPALRVDDPARAAGRYPLRRLSRIMAGPSVAWGGGSLALCLGAGIPVSILDGEGEVVGLCLPMRSPATPFSALLAELAESPRWREACGNWRLAAERRAVLAALRLARVGVADLRPAPVRTRLMELNAAAFGRAGRRVLAVWSGAAALAGVNTCGRLGIGPRLPAGLPGADGAPIPLVVELGRMLAWLPLGRLAAMALAGTPLPAGQRALAAAFHEQEAGLEALALELLGLLQGLAIEAARRPLAGRAACH